MSNTSTEILKRAKSYPYWLPDRSYIFYNGADYHFQLSTNGSLESSQIYWQDRWISMPEFYAKNQLDRVEELSDRIPVLASGSNGSPEQLARKFAQFPGAIVPVVKAELVDFDVVYSAHFSSYGSIPATLYYSPGTLLNTFVTYLTRSQLEQMHRTEDLGCTYCFAQLDSVKLTLENQTTFNQVKFYLSLYGCFCLNDSPICFAEISAENRQFPQMNEVEALKSAQLQLEPDTPLDNFILETVNDRNLWLQRIKRLKQNAKPFNYEHYKIVMGGAQGK